MEIAGREPSGPCGPARKMPQAASTDTLPPLLSALTTTWPGLVPTVTVWITLGIAAAVSMTDTVLSRTLATYARCPFGLRTEGWRR